jgi:hypothetical protein
MMRAILSGNGMRVVMFDGFRFLSFGEKNALSVAVVPETHDVPVRGDFD